MAKINHFLIENILVTSSFSTEVVVPSRIRCFAVTNVISVHQKAASQTKSKARLNLKLIFFSHVEKIDILQGKRYICIHFYIFF